MQRFNSTIKIKKGNCSVCGKYGGLTKGMCNDHYWLQIRMKSANKEPDEELFEEGLPELIEEADILFSRWLRLSNADKEGNVTCYTCDNKLHWKQAQCGHYISRSCIYLRHDVRNCRIQDEACNVHKRGNLLVFANRLEREKPGITEILYEESKLIYHTTREEMRGIIATYSGLLKEIQ